MNLKDCLLLGADCGLSSIGESITNVEIHSMSLFAYTEIENELMELNGDFKYLKSQITEKYPQSNFSFDLDIGEALQYINEIE